MIEIRHNEVQRVLRQVDAETLAGVDLAHADLCAADLHGADLSGANLWRANLMNADLSEADLRGAFMLGAILWGANLTGVRWDAATQWPYDYAPRERVPRPAPPDGSGAQPVRARLEGIRTGIGAGVNGHARS